MTAPAELDLFTTAYCPPADDQCIHYGRPDFPGCVQGEPLDREAWATAVGVVCGTICDSCYDAQRWLMSTGQAVEAAAQHVGHLRQLWPDLDVDTAGQALDRMTAP